MLLKAIVLTNYYDVNNHGHSMNYMFHFVKKEKIKNRILGANVKYIFTVGETDGGPGDWFFDRKLETQTLRVTSKWRSIFWFQ